MSTFIIDSCKTLACMLLPPSGFDIWWKTVWLNNLSKKGLIFEFFSPQLITR